MAGSGIGEGREERGKEEGRGEGKGRGKRKGGRMREGKKRGRKGGKEERGREEGRKGGKQTFDGGEKGAGAVAGERGRAAISNTVLQIKKLSANQYINNKQG